MENVTKEKHIIGLAIENKLCWTGAWLQNRGFDVLSPVGHAGCTSTVPYLQPHSERRMAYDIAEDLSLENIWIQTVTTDGDKAVPWFAGFLPQAQCSLVSFSPARSS